MMLKLYIKFKLSFLKTPANNKNIIEIERKISEYIKFKLIIINFELSLILNLIHNNQ